MIFQSAISLIEAQKRLLVDIAWEFMQSAWIDVLGCNPWNLGLQVGIQESQPRDVRVLRNFRLIKLDVGDMNAGISKKGYEYIEQDVLNNIAPVNFKNKEVA